MAAECVHAVLAGCVVETRPGGAVVDVCLAVAAYAHFVDRFGHRLSRALFEAGLVYLGIYCDLLDWRTRVKIIFLQFEMQ